METTTYLNNSGIALTEANRPNDAIPLFRKALGIDPGNPLLWLNLGIAQQRTGDYEEAIESFQKALGLDPCLGEAWFSMGLIFYEMEEFSLCHNCYDNALSHNDNDPRLWNNLGVLYFSQVNLDDARNCFEEAISIMPHYYDALYNVRDTCRQLGDYRAASEFERALSGLSSTSGPGSRAGFSLA